MTVSLRPSLRGLPRATAPAPACSHLRHADTYLAGVHPLYAMRRGRVNAVNLSPTRPPVVSADLAIWPTWSHLRARLVLLLVPLGRA